LKKTQVKSRQKVTSKTSEKKSGKAEIKLEEKRTASPSTGQNAELPVNQEWQPSTRPAKRQPSDRGTTQKEKGRQAKANKITRQ
jgi:hypothetical protein